MYKEIVLELKQKKITIKYFRLKKIISSESITPDKNCKNNTIIFEYERFCFNSIIIINILVENLVII